VSVTYRKKYQQIKSDYNNKKKIVDNIQANLVGQELVGTGHFLAAVIDLISDLI
jgi:hypothetical protein